jgi:uncharacterized SAM-binding protein YcdF (DUF218 family)
LTPAARRRVERAEQAFRDGVAARIIVSGGQRWGKMVEADEFAHALITAGVPKSVIMLERESTSTRENALFTARLLASHDLHEIALVTCAWHMPRALANFRAAGLDPIPLEAATPDSPGWRGARQRLRESVAGWLDARLIRRQVP